MNFFGQLFESSFMPHGHCYQWRADLVWLHAVSDLLIASAYFAIPIGLIYFVAKRRDLAFRWMFVLFGAFILLCGATHVLEVWSIWNATYWLTGSVKLVTGVVSAATAFMLVPLLPKAIALPSPAQLADANSALRREIEAREKAEEELRALNAELRSEIEERQRAERALEQANRSLIQRNRELQDFAYVASHDLKEPLRKVLTFSQLLISEYGEELDENAVHYVDRMRFAATRMSSLIDDLLEFSRVATGGETFRDVDLTIIADDVLNDLEVAIDETSARVEVSNLPKIEADPVQMQQLLQNLVSNALKFRREGVSPVVKIHAEVVDATTELHR